MTQEEFERIAPRVYLYKQHQERPAVKGRAANRGGEPTVAWGRRASLFRTNALVDRIDSESKTSLGAFKETPKMTKTRPAALAALPAGCALSLRTPPRNPNHHLWWNNGTWWLHATVHRPDYTKQRLRLPLETKNIHRARTQRDNLLASLCGNRKEAA